MLGNCHDVLLSANFFSELFFSKHSCRVSNTLDPDQDRHNLGPDLDPKLFVTVISRRQKSPLAGKESTLTMLYLTYIYGPRHQKPVLGVATKYDSNHPAKLPRYSEM